MIDPPPLDDQRRILCYLLVQFFQEGENVEDMIRSSVSDRSILEPMIKSLQPKNSQVLRRINDDYEDEAKKLINSLALSYRIVDAVIDGGSESTISDLELMPHNAGLDKDLQISIECRRRWKSDTSGFVIIDGNVTWKVLEG
jgi:hypothetical protein